MMKWIKLKIDFSDKKEYIKCIHELTKNEMVKTMKNYMQHGKVSCFEHCLNVSYYSYIICKRLGYDYYSAARGGLLHDFFFV